MEPKESDTESGLRVIVKVSGLYEVGVKLSRKVWLSSEVELTKVKFVWVRSVGSKP